MFVVDTNVLIYASDADAREHDLCRDHLERWRAQATPWYLTWGIVYEFLRVATHPRIFRTPWLATEAWSFLEAIMASPALRILSATNRHAVVLAEVITDVPHIAGNLVHDGHTATLMREHGVKQIVTRDTDFHRFPFLEVVDPLS